MIFHLLLLLFFLFPSNLLGQTTGFSGYDLNLFRPPRDGSGLLLNPGSQTLPPWRISLGADFHVSRNLLTAVNTLTGRRFQAFSRLPVVDFNLAGGISPYLSLGIGIPVILGAGQTNIPTEASYSFSGLADMDIDLKVNILGEGSKMAGLGLISTLSLPTGDPNRFTGFDDPTYWNRLVADKKWGPVYLAANIGYRFIGTKMVINVPVEDELTFGAGVSVRLPRGWEIFNEAAGYTVPSNPTDENTPFVMMGGIRKNFGRLTAELGGGGALAKGLGESTWTAAGGVSYRLDLKKFHVGPKKRLIGSEMIYFAFDRADFRPKWRKSLDRIVSLYQKEKNASVVISIGHADSAGPENYNQRLAEHRARNVASYLISQGVPASQIEIQALGESEPAADNRTREGKAKNRRVEVQLWR